MNNERLETHKTTINIPIDLYNELKRESTVLGINFNALLLIKIQEYQKQQEALKMLTKAIDLIEKEKTTN